MCISTESESWAGKKKKEADKESVQPQHSIKANWSLSFSI